MRRAKFGTIKTNAIKDAMTLLNADTSAKASAATVSAGIFIKNAAQNAKGLYFAAIYAKTRALSNASHAKPNAKTDAFIPFAKRNASSRARLV